MPFKQLAVTSQQPLPDGLTEWLQELGALSVTLEGDGRETLVERYEGDTPLWQEGRITALFSADVDEEQVARALEARDDRLSHDWSVLADRDWEREWMSRFVPLCFAGRLWVCPSWVEPPVPDAVNLILDPGMAFGTGTHETTSLCLEWLAEHALSGVELVDYGCGSGILAVAALLLGARRAWAVDIDARALETSRVNGARNGVGADRLRVMPPRDLPALDADLVIANILAEPLIQLAPALIDLLRPGGRLLLSGLLDKQQTQVRAAYEGQVRFAECKMAGEWVLLVGERS